MTLVMRVWKNMLVAAMLALWVPATVHCQLEILPGFEFLACCDHENEAPHQDDDCETDVCQLIESGLYKIEDNPAPLLRPGLAPPQFLLPALPLELSPALTAQVRPDSPPPDLSPCWRFVFRAAAPPRAPSFAS